jgi:predicted RNase H-like nuclease (RuvC/YqgF family)
MAHDRVCEHCGSDRYFAEQFPRLRDINAQLHRRVERVHSQAAVNEARLEMQLMETAEEKRWLQAKVRKQARVIRRLEEKMRERGRPAHEGAVDNEPTTGIL